MGKIARKGATPVYAQLVQGRSEFNEHKDCAVIAFSVITGMSYADSHAVLKKCGRKDRKGTYSDTTCSALKAAGLNYHYWTPHQRQQVVRSYPGIHGQVLKNITTHHPVRFPDVWEAFKEKRLLLITNGHILAFRDGKVHDWSSDRALRVIQIIEIDEA